MKARAPGKLVLSGSYSVLEGAPALVAAVDRYAEADTTREPPLVTAEVAAAIARGALAKAPWFDAGELRAQGRKLGLGSSAAILAASIGAAMLDRGVPEQELGERVLAEALPAHRAAQPGGSGVDVAAACLGGVLSCRLTAGDAGPGPLASSAHRLPDDLTVEVLACPEAASTQTMLARVHALRDRDRARYRRLIERAGEAAVEAAEAESAAALVAALARQFDALRELGEAAGAPIVTDAVRELDARARAHGACVGPSGAGGGDVAVRFGVGPSDPEFRAHAERAGLSMVTMRVGARGVHRAA